MAMKTVCVLTRAGVPCNLSYNGERFYIQTYIENQGGVDHIGSAYPVF